MKLKNALELPFTSEEMCICHVGNPRKTAIRFDPNNIQAIRIFSDTVLNMEVASIFAADSCIFVYIGDDVDL